MLQQLKAQLARHSPEMVKQLVRAGWAHWARWRPTGLPGPGSHLFVFGGRTRYWPELGPELYQAYPAFRTAVQACEQITTAELDGPALLPYFEGRAGTDFLADEICLMHLSAVMQLALIEIWWAEGVQADAMMGISLGEVAAVYAAGGLSLEDALRVSLCYGQVSVFTQACYQVVRLAVAGAEAARLLEGAGVELHVVLHLDTGHCLVMVPVAGWPAAQAIFQLRGIMAEPLGSEPIYPYHTALITKQQEALRPLLLSLRPRPLARPCYLATVDECLPAGTVLGIEYWLALVQYPVLVQEMLNSAHTDGYRVATPVGGEPFLFLPPTEGQTALSGQLLLPAFRPGASAAATFQEQLRVLTSLGLRGKQVLTAPAMSAADFVSQFNWPTPQPHFTLFPALAYLHQLGPVHFLPRRQTWLVLDGSLVEEVFRQPALFSSRISTDFDAELIGADPPYHTATRALLQPHFSPANLRDLAGFITEQVRQAGTARQQQGGRFDVMRSFTLPLVLGVANRLLGLPAPVATMLADLVSRHHTVDESFYPVVEDLFARHLRAASVEPPPNGLFAELRHQVNLKRFEPKAAAALLKTMWLAGITTTNLLLTGSIHHLLCHPVSLEQLRADPTRIDAFVEEMLRLYPSEMVAWRTTTQAVALGACTLEADALVELSLAGANRDPLRFAQPTEVRLNRPARRHHSFGGGIHSCLGAYVARLEARAVVQWVLEEPTLCLADPAALPTAVPSTHFYGLSSYELTFRPVSSNQ